MRVVLGAGSRAAVAQQLGEGAGPGVEAPALRWISWKILQSKMDELGVPPYFRKPTLGNLQMMFHMGAFTRDIYGTSGD